MSTRGARRRRRKRLKRREDPAGREGTRRISHLQGRQSPSSSSSSSSTSSSSSPASRFPSFPHHGRGRLYTPLQCLGVHYIQLGYFSREFSHVNAAKARTFARTPTTSSREREHVCSLDVSTHAHQFADLAGKVAQGANGARRNLARKFRSPPRD